ncbi:unnamed protein product, partial [Mesorhabditis spiculigera]
MIFVRTVEGATLTVSTEADDTVGTLKLRLAESQGIPAEGQRIISNGCQLEDDEGLNEESTYHLSLRLLGGAKKRKKKVYTTPKKNKHKRKKVKLAVLKFYEVTGDGIKRLRKECQNCGGGVFMAAHNNRHTCGRCHDTLVVEEQPKGGKGKKK